MEMYCRGSVYMTEKWVLGGMKDSPRRMSDKLVEAMPPKLEKVFSELELYKKKRFSEKSGERTNPLETEPEKEPEI